MMLNNMNLPSNAIHVFSLPQLCYRRPSLAETSRISFHRYLPAIPIPSLLSLTRGTSVDHTILSHAISHAIAGAILKASYINSSVACSSQGSVVVIKFIACTMASRQGMLVNAFFLDSIQACSSPRPT